MDGRSYPDRSDGARFADRCVLCVRIPVPDPDAPGALLQTAVLSAGFAAAVPPLRRISETDPVYSACGGIDGRGSDASDPAVRRNGLCGRNDGRDGSAARSASFGGLRCVSAAIDPKAAFGPQKKDAAYGTDGSACGAYLSAGRADRQRKSVEGPCFGSAGHSDRQRGRSAAASDSVYKSVLRRRSVRGTAGIGRAPAIRRRHGRLYLRESAGTDRRGAGDPAGKSFTV